MDSLHELPRPWKLAALAYLTALWSMRVMVERQWRRWSRCAKPMHLDEMFAEWRQLVGQMLRR